MNSTIACICQSYMLDFVTWPLKAIYISEGSSSVSTSNINRLFARGSPLERLID